MSPPIGGVYASLDAGRQQQWDGGQFDNNNRLSWAEDAITDQAYQGAVPWSPHPQAEVQGVYESVDDPSHAGPPLPARRAYEVPVPHYNDPLLQTVAKGEVLY